MNKWIIGLAVLLLAASNVWSYNYGVYVEGLRAEATASAQTATNATATTQAGVVERTVEQAAQAVVNEVSSYAVVDQNELVTALAVANGTAERLRIELAKTRDNLNGSGSYASLAERSASATRAALVLSELYGKCQGRLTELAGAFDQAHSRGMTCSTSYDNVRKLMADGG